VWLIPARELLDMKRESVLPLVPLSDHTMAELEEAIERLREHHDEELISQFLVHARVRYSEEEVARFAKMLEKHTLELLAEIKEVKDLRRKAKKEGRESGRQEGRQEGQLIGIRQAIRQALAERYPSLANDPAIEAIDDYARAQRIFSAVLRAKSAREAGAAIRG
jgi:predicted transposase YdaD